MLNIFTCLLVYIFISISTLNAQEVGKTEAKVLISEFVIEGTSDANELNEINELLLPYINTRLSFEDFKNIASEINDFYRSKMVLFNKVLIPEQDVSDGVLKYLIVKGTVGSVDVIGNKFYSKEFIKNGFYLKSGDYLDYGEIIKSITLLNEYTDLQVKSYLKKGSSFSATDIELQVEDEKPFHGSIIYDNLGSEEIAKDRLSLNVSYGNLITDGDTITLSSTLGFTDTDINTKLFSGDYSLVVGNYHTRVHAGYLYANYIAGSDFIVLEIEGTTSITALGITQPVIRSISNKVDISLDYSYKDVKNYLLGSISSEDKLNIITPSLYWQYMDMYSVFSLNLLIAKGISNPILQGSRVNQEVNLLKTNLNLFYNRKITDNNNLQLMINTQYSDDKLPVVEMFSIGGLSSVRGFRPSEKLGDSGFSSSLEWFYKPKFKTDWFKHESQVGLFVDYAQAYVNDAVAGETKDVTLLGAGVEVITTINEHYFTRINIGYPIDSKNIISDSSSQVYFILGAKF